MNCHYCDNLDRYDLLPAEFVWVTNRDGSEQKLWIHPDRHQVATHFGVACANVPLPEASLPPNVCPGSEGHEGT